jgi:uncharacterized protein YdaU (DUF1376 family)
MNYYPFHIGDYISHTSHLSDLEDLAYRRMIDLYYQTEEPFADIAWVARKVKSTPEIVKILLEEFFEFWAEDCTWRSKRADEEIAKYRLKADSARNANRVKTEKKSTLITELKSELISEPNHILTNNHNQEPYNQEPINNIKTISVESKIPPCPHQEIISIYHNTLPELPKVLSWNKTRESYLKQRWRQLFVEFECKSSEEGLDWFKNDFFQFVRDSKFLMGKVQSKDRKPFLADLEWMIKPTNFTKIIERKYEN